jgi:hypothetical protein
MHGYSLAPYLGLSGSRITWARVGYGPSIILHPAQSDSKSWEVLYPTMRSGSYSRPGTCATSRFLELAVALGSRGCGAASSAPSCVRNACSLRLSPDGKPLHQRLSLVSGAMRSRRRSRRARTQERTLRRLHTSLCFHV